MFKSLDGEIVGARCIIYLGCSVCKVKISTQDDVVGECGKCGLSSCCKYYTGTGKHHDIKMFHDIISKVIDDNNIHTQDETSLMKHLLATSLLRVNLDKKYCLLNH